MCKTKIEESSQLLYLKSNVSENITSVYYLI